MSCPTREISVIIPSYSHFEYARATLLSLHHYSPEATAVIVDDASPDWASHHGWYEGSGGRVIVYRFPQRGGLTRSWNHGFRAAKAGNARYVAFGNNDILFTENWWVGLVEALDSGYALVGPLSNAPGITATGGTQHIQTYLQDYRLTDDPLVNDQAARELLRRYAGRQVLSPINGFFMFGRTDSFARSGFSTREVFPPRLMRMPSGRKNANPLMTGQEDWLCHQWKNKNLRTGLALSSFIFHYRSVSRGHKFARTGWYRMPDLAEAGDEGGLHGDHGLHA